MKQNFRYRGCCSPALYPISSKMGIYTRKKRPEKKQVIKWTLWSSNASGWDFQGSRTGVLCRVALLMFLLPANKEFEKRKTSFAIRELRIFIRLIFRKKISERTSKNKVKMRLLNAIFFILVS